MVRATHGQQIRVIKGSFKKKKAAREEDARPDLEYGWEEECRIRHRALGGGVNPMTNVYQAPLYSTTTNNAYQLCKYADA